MAAAVLTEPEAAKAATTSAGDDLVYFSMPIEKSEDTKTVNPVDGTPDIEIFGKVTDGTVDSDLQVVDPEASLRWIKRWKDDGKANVRMQHDPKKPVGKGLHVDGHNVRALIADPIAKHFIRTGILNDWSIGIMNPDIRRGDPAFKHLDPAGKAINGVITDRADGLTGLGEISVVDRGSNYGTKFSLCKAAADGSVEWTGELTAPDEVLAKAAAPAKPKTVTVELPADMHVSIKPSQLARLATFGQQLAREQAAAKGAVPSVITKTAEPDAAKADNAAPEPVPGALHDAVLNRAAEAAVYKRDIDTATRSRLASEGKALSDGSYPIETESDMHNAYTLARSKHGKWKAALKLIARRAKQEGWTPPGKQDKVAAKGAKPQVTKCMKCDGSGMTDGKPCPDCKKGKKALKAQKRTIRKALRHLDDFASVVNGQPATKKAKVLCGGCGAKQSRKHQMCTECGKPMAGAMPVTKNHDFRCLGCGHDPLDKGEKHCPQCGKENPGYNPMADHKIPMNAGKAAAKERVSKRKKAKSGKGKKGNPFGDKQAPPFGAKDDSGEDGGKKPSRAKKAASPQAAKRKGKGKGRNPAHGVTGHGGDVKGLPAHREPDGAPVEEFEDDANMQDGDERQEMAAAMRHKALGAAGLSREDALLHDLTCAAFRPADVRKCFPYASLGDIDGAMWQRQALMKAAAAPAAEALAMRDLFRHAETLKNASDDLLLDLREQAHADFLAVNKVLTDATPGPASFPTPAHVTPQQYQRPYIHEGHSAPSPQQGAPHDFRVPEGQPSAEDFTRGFLADGRAADAPANDTPRHEPIPAPMTPGMPSRVYYTGAMRDNARQAMTAMHDHISRVFPDVCPMSPEVSGIQKPAPQVPEGVGGPAPRSGKKAAKAKARKQRKALAAKRRRLEQRVLKGSMTVKQARRKLGLKAKGANLTAMKLAKALPSPSVPVPSPLDPDVIKAAIAEANAPLLERIAAQDKTLRKQRKAIDAIADHADTSQAPLRGVVSLNKASAAPAAPQTATASAERVQMAELQRLHYVSRSSPDPGMREAARRDLETKLGLDSMTPQT